VRVEKQLTDWWLGSAGYLYSKLNADAAFRLDSLFPLGSPGFTDRWRSHEIVLERESHTFNATSLFNPWQHLNFSAGALGEWSRQEGFGRANLDLIFPTGFTLFSPATFNSSYDREAFEEMAGLRFTAIPYTSLFAETRLQQERIGEYEDTVGGPHDFLRDTDASSDLWDWRAGFNTSPWRRITLSAHYRQYEKETDFEHVRHELLDVYGYPGFIRWRDVKRDEIAPRLVIHYPDWLKTTFSYKYETSDYRTDTDFVSESAPNDITPGGRLEAADEKAHVYSLNTTFIPWQGLYLSGTFSYQNTRLTAFDNMSPSVVPYRGQVFTALASANYALNKATDLLSTYIYSWADYAQDNFADGLPVGIHYRQHGLTAGVSRRLTDQISAKLQYGFFLYQEPSSGGANDYTAHAVFGTLSIRMP
jgi:hypothetical protein